MNRSRNQAMTGGYPQQGYQTRPPTNWAQPDPPMQQPGYGYAQPGAYPGPPQYNTNQPPYSGYPPQPTSGGYATGWDQTTAPENQQTAQGGGYDYYSQQQPPQMLTHGGTGAPTDGSAYGYHQPPAYNQGQGYPQDNYGGYNMPVPQSGYGQPQPNPVPGYDQLQQGYNSTCGNTSNPAPADGQTDAYGTQGDSSQAPATDQAYNAGGQHSPNHNYAIQGSTQPGYGVPPSSQGGYAMQSSAGYGPTHGPTIAQKPPTSQPTYGQPQQSPSAQGGYAQPGYPHSQPPTTSYPTSQPGYGPPPYGAPPQPPAYNGYGGGYSQLPAYSSDGNSGASAHESYDATPPSQTVLPSGAAKASPSN